MNHTTIPVTAQGEPIPLVKLGQGREEEPQTFAAKLRAAGYQEPVLRTPVATKLKEGQIGGEVYGLKSETLTVIVPPPDTLPPVVSREGFRAGVLSAIAGGVIIACFYLAWGLVAACLFTAVCVGFVAGMLITQEWK